MNEGLHTIAEKGFSTLDAPMETKQLNEWIFIHIRPFLKGKILETGSGKGQMMECFVKDREFKLRLSDPDKYTCRALKQKYETEKTLKGIHWVNLRDETFEREYSGLLGRFDTVLALNTIDHNPIDITEATNAKKLLGKHGHLILLIPARTALFNELEEGIDFWRRRNRLTLASLFGRGMKLIKSQYFSVRFDSNPANPDLVHSSVPLEKWSRYDQMVPVFRVSTESLFTKIGLSLIAIGQKE